MKKPTPEAIKERCREMVTPLQRRGAISRLQAKGLAGRAACRSTGLSRAVVRCVARQPALEAGRREPVRQASQRQPRFGYRRVGVLAGLSFTIVWRWWEIGRCRLEKPRLHRRRRGGRAARLARAGRRTLNAYQVRSQAKPPGFPCPPTPEDAHAWQLAGFVAQPAPHLFGRDRQVADAHLHRVEHSVGQGQCALARYRPCRSTPHHSRRPAARAGRAQPLALLGRCSCGCGSGPPGTAVGGWPGRRLPRRHAEQGRSTDRLAAHLPKAVAAAAQSTGAARQHLTRLAWPRAPANSQCQPQPGSES